MLKLFTFLFVWLPLAASAQFSDSVTQFTRLSLAGNINRTNLATNYLLHNDARYSIKNPRTVLNTAVNWVYGKQAALLTNNDVTTTTDFNLYNEKGNFYYWGLANFTTSISLRINRQLQTGLGAAYNFVNTQKAWINLSDGLVFETSSIVRRNIGDEAYQTVRNSLRLSYRFVIRDIITINGTNYWQSSLNNANDYIIRSQNGAGIKLNKWLSFATTISYNQFRRTGTENLLFTYGLAAEKYF
jgi:hypothetical protein